MSKYIAITDELELGFNNSEFFLESKEIKRHDDRYKFSIDKSTTTLDIVNFVTNTPIYNQALNTRLCKLFPGMFGCTVLVKEFIKYCLVEYKLTH